MQLGIFPQIDCFTFKGIRVTFDPLFPVIILFLFWEYIVAGALGLALAGLVAFTALILWHELGHAVMARLCHTEIYSINLHWFGGSCQHGRAKTRERDVLIASGGILAQALLMIGAIITAMLLPTITPAMAIVLHTFIKTNLVIMVVNLLPIPSFDGGKIFSYLKDRFVK
jgi:Zn-dependent protease